MYGKAKGIKDEDSWAGVGEGVLQAGRKAEGLEVGKRK